MLLGSIAFSFGQASTPLLYQEQKETEVSSSASCCLQTSFPFLLQNSCVLRLSSRSSSYDHDLQIVSSNFPSFFWLRLHYQHFLQSPFHSSQFSPSFLSNLYLSTHSLIQYGHLFPETNSLKPELSNLGYSSLNHNPSGYT